MSLSKRFQSNNFSGGKGLKLGSGINSGLNRHTTLPNQIPNCLVWYLINSSSVIVSGSQNRVTQLVPQIGVSQSVMTGRSTDLPYFSASIPAFNNFPGMSLLTSGAPLYSMQTTGSVPLGGQQFTVAFSSSPLALNQFASIFTRNFNNTTNFEVDYVNGQILIATAITNSGGLFNGVNCTTTDVIGQSARYVCTFDLSQSGSMNQMKIYRNGQNLQTNFISQFGTGSVVLDAPLVFDHQCQTKLPELILYNRVLTSQEIQALDQYLQKYSTTT